MNNNEALTQLAALQSLYKLLGEVLSTKNPDGLRGQADARFRELYESTGIDRIRLTVNDEEVGKYVAKVSSPTKRTVMHVNDVEALLDDNIEVMKAFVREHRAEYADYYLDATGAVPDGCEMTVEDVPAQWLGTTITGCKPEKVLPMLGIGRVTGYLEEV